MSTPESLVPALSKYTSSQVTAFSTQNTFTNTIKTTVSSVRQSVFSQSAEDNASLFGFGGKIGAASGNSTSTKLGDEYTVTLGTKQTASTQQTFSSSISVGDCSVTVSSSGSKTLDCSSPAPPHPPSVDVFLDTRFGTMMASLPELTIKPPNALPIQVRGVAELLPGTGLAAQHISALQGAGTPKKSQFIIQPSQLSVAQESLASHNPAPLITTTPKGYGGPVAAKWQGHVFPPTNPAAATLEGRVLPVLP